MQPTYDLTRWLFLRALGLVYVVAFASLAVQIVGLVGDQGILPARDFLEAAGRELGGDAPWRLPSVCWLVGATSGVLQTLAWAGVGCGAALLLGLAPRVAAVGAWALYLSLVGVGQVFLAFQWDALLLEAGVLGLLLAPGGLRPGLGRTRAPRPLLWLCWLLVFKLHLMSGLVKLASDDPAWRALSALEYHYWTTCLPVWVGWWLHQLPPWVHRTSVALMFAIELGLPFAIWGPRRLRHAACAGMVLLQIAIAASGNYGFFNLLTIVLCLTLLDDVALAPWLGAWRRTASPAVPSVPGRVAAVILAAVIATLSLGVMLARFSQPGTLPRPLTTLLARLQPLHLVSGYGLFASMTTRRPEIVVEGTLDGHAWRPYEFRWKPGDPRRRPAFVQPHMPRLDWQMWFAALQGPRRAYWFRRFLARLQARSPAVLALLAHDPFEGRRPRGVRAELYEYRFTTRAERRASGRWWQRERRGIFVPAMTDLHP